MSESSSIFSSLKEGALSYLSGTFYGGGGTLTANEKSVVYDGDTKLSLTPTSVGKIKLTKGEDSQKAVVVYFDAALNNGTNYRLYADILNDGFIHLEKEEGDSYTTIATFQPDVSKCSGTYSGYPVGDDNHGVDYNNYLILDPNFDAGRDAYPMSSFLPYYSSYSSEQAWHYIARIRLSSLKQRYYTVEFYDSDNYGFGELSVVKTANGYWLSDGYYGYYTDEGAYNGLNLFDGESGDSFSVTLTEADKTITFGEKTGTYELAYDDLGTSLNATFGEEKASIRMFDHYLSYESDGKTSVYPIDSVDDLKGTFTDKTNTFSCDSDSYTGEYTVKFNDKAVDYKCVIENNRKSFSFDVDGVNYIISPDKYDVAVRVNKGGDISYYINGSRYDEAFVDDFVAHDKDNSFTLSVSSDFTYTLNNESGKAVYSYTHGDRYPSLVLEESANHKKLTPVFESAGYFVLESDNADDVTLYSASVLNEAYNTYSSNGKDTLVFDKDKLTYNGKSYDYEFTPHYQEGTGYYNFAVTSSLGLLIYDPDGCVYIGKSSFITKDTFATIAGTYSLYGKYGIENIKMSATGDLTLDTVNKAGDGLDRDVSYEYAIIMMADSSYNVVPVLAFVYEGIGIDVYFYDDHLMIAGLDYYREEVLNSWGVYVDEANENILYLNESDVYLNGDSLTIKKRSESDGKLVYETSSGTITIDTTGTTASATIVNGEDTINLTRKYTYEDYSKFAGEYDVNSTTVKFGKASSVNLTYEAVVGEGDSASTIEFSDMKFVLKDGKVALKFSVLFSGDYYLSMDEETNTVSASFEASSLPPIPPAPPAPPAA